MDTTNSKFCFDMLINATSVARMWHHILQDMQDKKRKALRNSADADREVELWKTRYEEALKREASQ